MFFLTKLEALKDPVVVSEEAYAVQLRSRTGIDAEAVKAALAGGLHGLCGGRAAEGGRREVGRVCRGAGVAATP